MIMSNQYQYCHPHSHPIIHIPGPLAWTSRVILAIPSKNAACVKCNSVDPNSCTRRMLYVVPDSSSHGFISCHQP